MYSFGFGFVIIHENYITIYKNYIYIYYIII